MLKHIFITGLILAGVSAYSQELPAGLSSKCECSNVKTSRFTYMEVVAPTGLYLESQTQASVWQKDNKLTLIFLDGSETILPVAWSQTWGSQTKVIFTDLSYAILTPSSQEGTWSEVRLYTTPPWGSTNGTLYLTLYNR